MTYEPPQLYYYHCPCGHATYHVKEEELLCLCGAIMRIDINDTED